MSKLASTRFFKRDYALATAPAGFIVVVMGAFRPSQLFRLKVEVKPLLGRYEFDLFTSV